MRPGSPVAWLGGIATLLGIVLLLGLAISHDWIGPVVRVVLAGVGSAGLMAGGIWLHRRGGRTEAAIAIVGTATAGAFATLVVAGEVYDLIPAAVAVAGSMAVGALATALAIRWAGRAIAVLGLIGALLSPPIVERPKTPPRSRCSRSAPRVGRGWCCGGAGRGSRSRPCSSARRNG